MGQDTDKTAYTWELFMSQPLVFLAASTSWGGSRTVGAGKAGGILVGGRPGKPVGRQGRAEQQLCLGQLPGLLRTGAGRTTALPIPEPLSQARIQRTALVTLPCPRQASDVMTRRGWASRQGGAFEALLPAMGQGCGSNNVHPLRTEVAPRRDHCAAQQYQE